MSMQPDRIVEFKVERDRPVRWATRYITRDEATAAALVIGAALGIAGAVVLALIAASRSSTEPSGPRSAVVVTTQEVD